MNLYDIVTPMTVDEAKATSQRLDATCWKGKHKEGTKVKGGVRVNNCVPNEGIAEAQTDYQKRRQRERDIDAGKPVPKQRQSSMTDYQKRRAEQKRQEQLGENAWNDGTNDWTSEHDQWTKENINQDPINALTGVDEAISYESNKAYAEVGPHKRYTVYVGKKKFNDKFGFIAVAVNPRTNDAKFKANGATQQEAVEKLKSEVDKEIDVATKVSGSATIDFNVDFVRDVLEMSSNTFYAKIVPGPKLVIAGKEMEQYPDIMKQEGFKTSSIRTVGDSEGATKLPAMPLSATGATTAQLVANGRYALGAETIDKDGNRIFDLEFDSVVADPRERIRMGAPAITIGTKRETAESSNDPVAIDSTSPVGGNVQEGRLQVGDPVIVTAPNAYEGKTGEIAEFSPSGKFVIVDLYNHGRHSMHLSDVEYNQYADEEDEYEELDELDVNTLKSYADKRGAQVAAMKADNPNPQTGSKEWVQQAVPAQQVGLANRKIARKERQAGVAEAGNPAQQAAIAIAKKKEQGVAEGRVDPILLKALKRMPDGLATHHEVLDAAYDAYAMEKGYLAMKGNHGVTDVYIPKLMGLYKDKHGLTFNEEYTPSPAKPFRNPKGFNKQGTGVGNRLAQQTRAELAKKKQSGVAEGHADQQRRVFKKNGEPVGEVGIDRESSPGNGQWYMKCYAYNIDNAGYDSYEEAVAELKHCMQQGVAEVYTPSPAKPFRNPPGFNKQGTGVGNKLAQLNRKEWEEKKKKEQGVAEDTGSWIVYDPETKQIKKRFKTHTAGKSYAQTHKLGFASSEYYFDRVKGQEAVAESTNYWTKLQNERNTKLNTLVNELKEITK